MGVIRLMVLCTVFGTLKESLFWYSFVEKLVLFRFWYCSKIGTLSITNLYTFVWHVVPFLLPVSISNPQLIRSAIANIIVFLFKLVLATNVSMVG